MARPAGTLDPIGSVAAPAAGPRPSREGSGLRDQAARRAAARGAGLPQHLLRGDVQPGLPDRLPLFNAEPDIVCERVFLPPKSEIAALRAAGTPIVTLESQTLVRDFDVLAFSVSFEWDYTNVLTMLSLAGVPRRAADRTQHDPLVIIGGAVTFVNPEPLALFADVIAAGEGEALVPPLVDAFQSTRRPRRSAAPAGDGARLLRAVVLRRAVQRRTARSTRSSRSRAPARPPSCARPRSRRPRPSIRRSRRSSRPTPSSARASWSRWCAAARTCAGSAGPATTTCPCARFPNERILQLAQARARTRTASGWCRSRCAITRTSRRSSSGLVEMGYSISPASLRLDDLTPTILQLLRESGERTHHDRAGDRIGSAAPRDQQDDHQRRDPRGRRADLRRGLREPEAVLHDRACRPRPTRISSRSAI